MEHHALCSFDHVRPPRIHTPTSVHFWYLPLLPPTLKKSKSEIKREMVPRGPCHEGSTRGHVLQKARWNIFLFDSVRIWSVGLVGLAYRQVVPEKVQVRADIPGDLGEVVTEAFSSRARVLGGRFDESFLACAFVVVFEWRSQLAHTSLTL